MKLKIVSLAAAAALSMGFVGAAGSANAAGMGNALSGPVICQAETAQKNNAKQVSYYGYRYSYRRCMRLRYLARMGSRWARHMYRRHCRFGYHSRYRKCRALYVRGYVYGNPYARHMYRKYCRFYRVGYRY